MHGHREEQLEPICCIPVAVSGAVETAYDHWQVLMTSWRLAFWNAFHAAHRAISSSPRRNRSAALRLAGWGRSSALRRQGDQDAYSEHIFARQSEKDF